MNIFKYFIICIITLSCNSSKSTPVTDTISILFIGNSLTYTNNLPKLVEDIAKTKGVILQTKTIAYPNYALIDHWNDGTIQKEIQSKKYDYVIVQQGPSSQQFGREVLIEYGKKLSTLCMQNNSTLCYFMVWPSRQYYYTFDKVIQNHKDASKLNTAILLPVGEAWKHHFDSTLNFDYYGPDGFHPSQKGSEASAEIIVEHLFK